MLGENFSGSENGDVSDSIRIEHGSGAVSHGRIETTDVFGGGSGSMELDNAAAIKQLTGTNQEVSKLLNLFTSTDAKGFEKKLGQFKKLMKEEGLTKDELTIKKSYVQICSLSTEVTNFAYSELAELLNIAEDEIESWAIDAIQNKIIDAKIDQHNEEIVIKSHMLRELKTKEWQAIL